LPSAKQAARAPDFCVADDCCVAHEDGDAWQKGRAASRQATAVLIACLSSWDALVQEVSNKQKALTDDAIAAPAPLHAADLDVFISELKGSLSLVRQLKQPLPQAPPLQAQLSVPSERCSATNPFASADEAVADEVCGASEVVAHDRERERAQARELQRAQDRERAQEQDQKRAQERERSEKEVALLVQQLHEAQERLAESEKHNVLLQKQLDRADVEIEQLHTPRLERKQSISTLKRLEASLAETRTALQLATQARDKVQMQLAGAQLQVGGLQKQLEAMQSEHLSDLQKAGQAVAASELAAQRAYTVTQEKVALDELVYWRRECQKLRLKCKVDAALASEDLAQANVASQSVGGAAPSGKTQGACPREGMKNQQISWLLQQLERSKTERLTLIRAPQIKSKLVVLQEHLAALAIDLAAAYTECQETSAAPASQPCAFAAGTGKTAAAGADVLSPVILPWLPLTQTPPAPLGVTPTSSSPPTSCAHLHTPLHPHLQSVIGTPGSTGQQRNSSSVIKRTADMPKCVRAAGVSSRITPSPLASSGSAGLAKLIDLEIEDLTLSLATNRDLSAKSVAQMCFVETRMLEAASVADQQWQQCVGRWVLGGTREGKTNARVTVRIETACVDGADNASDSALSTPIIVTLPLTSGTTSSVQHYVMDEGGVGKGGGGGGGGDRLVGHRGVGWGWC